MANHLSWPDSFRFVYQDCFCFLQIGQQAAGVVVEGGANGERGEATDWDDSFFIFFFLGAFCRLGRQRDPYGTMTETIPCTMQSLL